MSLNVLSSNDVKLLKRSFEYAKPYRFKLMLLFLCIASGVVFGLIQPFLWAKIISGLFAKNFEGILKYLLYNFLIQVFDLLIQYYQSYLFTSINNNMVYDLKSEMQMKILNLPVKAFDEMRVGDFVSRLNGDVGTISNIVTDQLLNTVMDIFRVIAIGITVFSITVSLSSIVVASFLISYFIFLVFGKYLRIKNMELKKLFDDYFSILHQSISGIREIKGLGLKKKNYETNINMFGILRSKQISLTMTDTTSQILSNFVSILSGICIMVLGAYFIFKGSLEVELFIAFSSYSGQFNGALSNLTKLNSNIQQSLASLERIFGLIDNLNFEEESFGSKDIENIKGNVRFEDVTFSYKQDRIVLEDISINIKSKKKVAIVGRSGSGKTTLFNLILRFYKPDSGKIFIDDMDITELSEDALRKHIGIVAQSPYLFNISIMDNLLISSPKASKEEVYEACKKAYIHDYIMNLPNKYETIVEENGTNLSSGQKQRIAIARVLLKKSKIILFDEATSALDNESQFYIKKSIDKMTKNQTVIIIAHRLSTVMDADEIIVLDNGKIVDKGNHYSLMRGCNVYKQLFEAEWEMARYSAVEEI